VTDSRSLVSVRLGGNSHAKPEVVEFLRRSGVFAQVAGEHDQTFANWNDGTETRRLHSVVTTRNFFTALGPPMAHGRGYSDQDPNEVAVLHHHFWRKHFRADPSIVGRAINLEGRPYTVVGVLTPSHRTLTGFGFAPDLFLPHHAPSTPLAIYARLKPGQSRAAALEAVKSVGARLDAELPERWFKYAGGCRVSSIAGFARLAQEDATTTVAVFFLVLLAIAGLVLLIACVNVASLLLARAAGRRREVGVRLALGAGRARLLQQLLVESLLLALLGAAFGLAMAHVASKLLMLIPLPLPVPIRLVIEQDWRVAIYAALLTVVSTLACGLLLAAVGLYGTLAYSVTRRAPEIAVRLAIGATPAGVAGMVLRDSITLIGWGSAAGLVVAFFVTQPLAAFLVPGIRPTDPLNFSVVTLVFLLVGAAAAIGPARSAAAIDPASTVRVQ
jgi:hypothetical protein